MYAASVPSVIERTESKTMAPTYVRTAKITQIILIYVSIISVQSAAEYYPNKRRSRALYAERIGLIGFILTIMMKLKKKKTRARYAERLVKKKTLDLK